MTPVTTATPIDEDTMTKDVLTPREHLFVDTQEIPEYSVVPGRLRSKKAS